MTELIQQLEIAVLRRNLPLAERLQPGLPIEKIEGDLKRAGIGGAIEPIIELYSWRNGTRLHGESKAVEAGFVPPIAVKLSEEIQQYLLTLGVKRETDFRTYNFIELKQAILDAKAFKESANNNPKLSILDKRYFPILWDGSTAWIAIDTEPSSHNRVVAVQWRDEQPLREAYESFVDFLKDTIQANESNESLVCFRTIGRPITEVPEVKPKPAAKFVAPKTSKIPEPENPLVLRADFSDEAAWQSLCKILQRQDGEFSPSFDFISDPALDGLTPTDLQSLLSEDSSLTFAFIVDRTALTHSNHPVQVIDLHDKPGRTFRVSAIALGEVANNLSIANMDFDDFAKATDKDGIFRGFSRD